MYLRYEDIVYAGLGVPSMWESVLPSHPYVSLLWTQVRWF